MELLELVLAVTVGAAEMAVDITTPANNLDGKSFLETIGNKDYTVQKLLDDIKAGTDIYDVNYEKDVYKELKEMYRKKNISKYEYEKLVEHQKSMDI